MVIVLIGASGTGKSTIENEIAKCGYEKIISYTTRKPRPTEINGKDYYFTDNENFIAALNNNLFAEYEEYTQNRLYGTLKSDYKTKQDKVVVLTPNGFRNIKKFCNDNEIYSVLVETNLGTRIKRYINRCGVSNFDYDDANEIFGRINKDFGMFLGVDKEVDLIVHNNDNSNLKNIIEEIIRNAKKK